MVSDFFCLVSLFILRFHLFPAKDVCEKSFEGNRCIRLDNKMCFAGNLSYNYTSHVLVSDRSNVYQEMKFWENLKNVPKCWDVVRPVLCSIYLPRCDYDVDGNKSLIQLPRKKMCHFMKDSCKIIEELQLWPVHLFCNYSYYTEGCNDGAMDIKFASTSSCQYPLIKTSSASSWYPGFEGCSFNCQSPWYTVEEHNKVHLTVFALGLLCITLNFFVVFTFACNWKNLNSFPDVIILYTNACYLVSSFGWLFQFIPNLRQVIVCKLDGTTKRVESQFNSDESMLCVIVFVIIYFFTLSSVAWQVVLSYTWQIAFETSRSQVNKKKAYLHLGVWVVSIVLTILCLAFTEINGDSLTGICFISANNFLSRGIFVLIPLSISFIAGLAFLLKGLFLLQNMKSQSPDLLSRQKKAKLKSSIIRIGLFTFALMILGITALGLQIYAFVNFHKWMKSMREFIVCSSKLTDNDGSCFIRDRPSIVSVQLSVFCHFGFGILLSSWLWRLAAIKSWKTFLVSKFCVSYAPIKHTGMCVMDHQKNYICAISETDDLIGMDFDLNSMTSFDVSSISSILTTNRRHSESDVSSFEKRISIPTKSQTLKPTEKYIEFRRGSFSSSEWSGSESQKSHYSINNSFGLASGSAKLHYDVQNQTLAFNEMCLCKQSCVDSIPNQTVNKPTASFSGVRCKYLHLSFDLNAFRAKTMTIYDKFEDCVLNLENSKKNFNQIIFKESKDSETFDSSNSNYTLASSNSSVTSIKCINSNGYCNLIDLSIDSLVENIEIAHKDRKPCNPSFSKYQNNVNIKKDCNSAEDLRTTFEAKCIQVSSEADESGNVSDSDFEIKKNSKRWARRKRFLTLRKI